MAIFTPFAFVKQEAAAPAVALLLDDYPSATAAYSVRKLRSDYSGNCMQIYRVSDGATQGFGFDVDGYLDVSGIQSFLGASNGLVNIWYDQSGGTTYDMDFSTNTRPLIATAGVVTTTYNGGKASMTRPNALGLDLGFKSRGNKTFFCVASNESNSGATQPARIISNYDGSGAVSTDLLVDFFPSAGLRVFDGGDAAGVRGYFPNTSVSADSVIAGYTKNSGAINGIYNGSTTGSPGTGASDSVDQNVYAFEDRTGGGINETSKGISEIVIWDNQVLSLSGISTNLNNFYGLY